jgi:hypothetical protein
MKKHIISVKIRLSLLVVGIVFSLKNKDEALSIAIVYQKSILIFSSRSIEKASYFKNSSIKLKISGCLSANSFFSSGLKLLKTQSET